jgi:branched-chain amino acid transport system substrate-binding protein
MSSSRTRIHLVAGTLALAGLSAACGLKPEATDALSQPGAAVINNGTGAVGAGGVPVAGATPGAGTPVAGGTSGLPVGGGGTTTGGTTTGGTTTTGSGGTTNGGTTNGGGGGGGGGTTAGACGVPTGGDTTGITSSTINIGFHAPLTGTGTPFPNESFRSGGAKFWEQAGHTVCGRKVTVEIQDDTYTPAGARDKCSAMASRDFLVVGGGGTDQIQACATDPNIQRNGVPYLSAGVTDNGLTGLNNYFAVSLTYQQQGTLVLRNAKSQGFARPTASRVASDNVSGKNAEWAIVTASSPNFDGATKGMQAALDAAGIPYKVYRQDQQGDYKAAATQFGQQLALNGFRTIYVTMAPGYFVFMSGGYYSGSTGNTANWVGPGVTFTQMTVAQLACSATHRDIHQHAWFLAPNPGLDRATDDFKKAYGSEYDDIQWALWGLSESLWKMLKNASANLTRENFIATSQRSQVSGGSYPTLDFAGHGGHFGGTGAWVQRVNCNEREPGQEQFGTWDTIGSTYLRLF